MFKVTKADLAQKTDAQLAALFQQASHHLKPSISDTPQAQSLLAMIRAEITRRGRRP
ncbi:hypothetical protein [Sphingobium sp. SCG-1]|uniref:hypothetical protein n=1 Tax=Sphingobium sp. SCG-1 TaxID=2072936 RepID=UPI00166FC480|nr:hypothetical protein [Sphingobium sp. SCG-1]